MCLLSANNSRRENGSEILRRAIKSRSMKNLRLDIEQAQCDGQLIIWQIPLRLEHQKVGLSSMQVIFTDKWNEHMLTSDNPIRMIPVQCSLLKENMWNPRGVFFHIDLF